MGDMKSEYPRIKEIGLKIHTEHSGPEGINGDELYRALHNHGLSCETFDKFFGCQTMSSNGAYPWDVEDVLERMMSGKRMGTQLIMD